MLFTRVAFHVSLTLFIAMFFFKQKTAYEMRISDWSSDVCSSDLIHVVLHVQQLSPTSFAGAATSEDAPLTAPLGRPPGSCSLLSPPWRVRRREHPARIARFAGLARRRDLRFSRPMAGINERSEERRVGQGCFRTCRYRVWR